MDVGEMVSFLKSLFLWARHAYGPFKAAGP